MVKKCKTVEMTLPFITAPLNFLLLPRLLLPSPLLCPAPQMSPFPPTKLITQIEFTCYFVVRLCYGVCVCVCDWDEAESHATVVWRQRHGALLSAVTHTPSCLPRGILYASVCVCVCARLCVCPGWESPCCPAFIHCVCLKSTRLLTSAAWTFLYLLKSCCHDTQTPLFPSRLN